jgi:DNA (cytosine-5)-methyltransferase 1
MDLAKLQGSKVSREVANLPTPTTRDYKDGSADHARDGKVQTDTVARAIFSSGEVKLFNTPTTMDAKATNDPAVAQKFLDQGRQTCLTYDVATNWGKFGPAIRRWEDTLGRIAPAPTKPDGKEGNHRLSSKFTEWMMGLPDGWITNVGLTRNEELKLAGNGVVPQQAELALKILLENTPPR